MQWITKIVLGGLAALTIQTIPTANYAILPPNPALEATSKLESLISPLPVVEKLIACESGGKSVKIIDSNGYYSYGILQYQSSTWNWWSKESGIKGDPMNEEDAIRMANWAVEHGYGFHWSCWSLI